MNSIFCIVGGLQRKFFAFRTQKESLEHIFCFSSFFSRHLLLIRCVVIFRFHRAHIKVCLSGRKWNKVYAKQLQLFARGSRIREGAKETTLLRLCYRWGRIGWHHHMQTARGTQRQLLFYAEASALWQNIVPAKRPVREMHHSDTWHRPQRR